MKNFARNIALLACFRNDPALEGIDETTMSKIINREPITPTGGATGGSGGGGNGGAAGAGAGAGAAGSAAAGGNGGAAAGAAAGGATGGAGGDGGTGAGAAATEPVLDFSKIGGGRYKTIDEINAALTTLDSVPNLQKQLTEALARIPNYSDRVKKVVEFASQYEGMEDTAAQRYLQLTRLGDLSGVSDQQIRFEAFKLDPRYAKLAEDKQKTLFAHLESAQYGDPNNAEKPQTPEQAILQEVATTEAKAKIQELIQGYQTAKAAQLTPEEMAAENQQLVAQVTQELATFDGIPFNFSVLDEKGEKVNSSMNFKMDATQMKELVEAVADPLGKWDALLEAKGVFANPEKPDRKKFAQVFSRLLFSEQIESQIYQQGWNDLLAHLLKNHRNPGTQNNNGGTGGAGGGGQQGKPNDLDKLAEQFAQRQGLLK